MKKEVLQDLQERYFDFKKMPVLPAENFINHLDKLVDAGTTVILELCRREFPEYIPLMQSRADFFEHLMATLQQRIAAEITYRELEDIKALVVNFAEGEETSYFFDVSLFQPSSNKD